jgi:hypothetical protein
MLASVRTLLANIVDYAGLFPPARLPLDEAVRNYARYRSGPDSWMLGGFVCPVTRLGELSAFREELYSDRAVPLAVLGRGGEDAAGFLGTLAADLDSMAEFTAVWAGRAKASVLETKLPRSVVAAARKPEHDQIWNGLRHCSADRGMKVFCEVPLTSAWREEVPEVVSRLAELPGLGLKLRTGGLDASAFPSIEQVAGVIAACADGRVPLKFTAGLHHPLRRFDPSVGTVSHGFLNVFAAGVLAFARGWDGRRLERVLAEDEPAAFRPTDTVLHWRDEALTCDELRRARAEGVISFGSCSFDEPREDLHALGWLGPGVG